MQQRRKKHILARIMLFLLLALGIAAIFSAKWYTNIYGDVGFDAVMFTVFTTMEGVESGIVTDYLLNALLPTILTLIVVYSIIFFIPLRKRKREVKNRFSVLPFWLSAVISIVLSLTLFITAVIHSGLSVWILNNIQKTDIYQDQYVSPRDVEIKFPKEKQNLIYIYLESMETTFFSEKLHGANQNMIIPELFNLACLNTNLSHNNLIGGARTVSGSTWTTGAFVAHSSGLPLKLPLGVDGNSYSEYFDDFLPGVTTINDILADAGYIQTAMFGSDSAYGGKKQFLEQHGVDKILDIYTAYTDGIVPEDYWEWWGMEDKYLYEYAKKELTCLSRQDKPFAFTMLTADTHHIGGFVCDKCRDKYGEQYENVYACASKQLDSFISWLENQEFFSDTTIVITGDHYSMDDGYMQRNISKDFTRRVYNCIINSVADDSLVKRRDFTTLDMFPTTMAAMGCEIKGERLGLGTNIFSGVPTLSERLGYEKFNHELALTSEYYNKEFLRLDENTKSDD